MSKTRDQCTACFHGRKSHDKDGQCSAKTSLEGFRGPDGRCTCPKYHSRSDEPTRKLKLSGIARHDDDWYAVGARA